MVGWIALAVALVIVLGVLGYCAYELRWRAARLQKDLAGLRETVRGLQQLGADMTAVQARAARLPGEPTQPSRG